MKSHPTFVLAISLLIGCASTAEQSLGDGTFTAQPDAASALQETVDAPPPLIDGGSDGSGSDGSGSNGSAGSAGSGSAGSGSAGSGAPTGPCADPFVGVLATWSFAGQPGNEISVAAASTATGVTAGVVGRSSNVIADAGSASINSRDWATTATRDPTKYYTFSVAPPAGCRLSLTGLSIDAKASTSGPATAVLATSADGFSATTPIGTAGTTTEVLSVTAAGAVEVRVYGYGATKTTGTFRVASNLIVSGSLE
jgi:hypothetical protein